MRPAFCCSPWNYYIAQIFGRSVPVQYIHNLRFFGLKQTFGRSIACVSQHKNVKSVFRKKASYFLLNITRDTRKRAERKQQLKSDRSVLYLNNGSHGHRTSAQPQGKLSLLGSLVYLKFIVSTGINRHVYKYKP